MPPLPFLCKEEKICRGMGREGGREEGRKGWNKEGERERSREIGRKGRVHVWGKGGRRGEWGKGERGGGEKGRRRRRGVMEYGKQVTSDTSMQ